MYVSVDEGNTLRIILEQDSKTVDYIEIKGFNKGSVSIHQNVLKSWKMIKLYGKHNGDAFLLTSRLTEDGTGKGYWAVANIEFCKNKFGKH